jgi:hypothetical protein
MLVTFLQAIAPSTNQMTLTDQFTSGVGGKPIKGNYTVDKGPPLAFPIEGRISAKQSNYQFWS